MQVTPALRYGVFAAGLLLAAIALGNLHTHARWLNETGTVASIVASLMAVWMFILVVRAVKRGPHGSDG